MEDRLIKPFIDATIKVLDTMAFVKPVPGETCLWDNAKSVGEVVGIIGFSNEAENVRGLMAVGFTQPSICRVVSNMLGEEFSTICDEVREAVGEIANMISGQARQQLSELGIKLQASLPSVVSGKELIMEGSSKQQPMIMVGFKIEEGPFEIGICLDGL